MSTPTQTAGSNLLTQIVGLIALALLVLLLDLRNEAPAAVGLDVLPAETAVLAAPPHGAAGGVS